MSGKYEIVGDGRPGTLVRGDAEAFTRDYLASREPAKSFVDGIRRKADEAVQDALIRESGKDPFNVVVDEILGLNRRKRADYTGGEDPWQNFKDSSSQVGQVPGFSVEVLIGTKQARLKQLLFTGREVNNESVRDSLIDRAVYSIIALAMYDQGLYAQVDDNPGGQVA